MATITRRSDGQYQAKIRLAGHPVATNTFPSRREAESWAAATETDMRRGEYIPRRKVEQATLAQVLERYAREVSCKKKGEKQELVRINKLKLHPLAKKPIDTIQPEDIEKYIYQRRSQPSQRAPARLVSDATIRLEVALLSSVFESARTKRWNYCRANPVREIDPDARPSKANRRERRLEGDEEQRLLAELDRCCRNPDISRVVRLALTTAARQSELIGKPSTSTRPASPGLCWEDVKLDAGLRIGTATLNDTKNGKNRTIPLSSEAYRILSGLPRPINGGSIFRVTQDGLIRAVAAACKRAGIVGVTFHTLRHEATSRMVENGWSLPEVQHVTGHSSAEMALHYTHIDALKLAQKM